MGYYDRMSAKVFGIIEEHSVSMEKFSVDECFFNRTGLVPESDSAIEDYARQVQQYVLQMTGMPITFGFARTRLVAKMFCKFKKPFGVFGSIQQSVIEKALDTQPLRSIPFI